MSGRLDRAKLKLQERAGGGGHGRLGDLGFGNQAKVLFQAYVDICFVGGRGSRAFDTTSLGTLMFPGQTAENSMEREVSAAVWWANGDHDSRLLCVAALTNIHAPRILTSYEWLRSSLRHLPPDYLQLAIRWLRPPFLTSQENGRPASQAGIVHGA
jgi:hypothetical protein